MADRADLEDAVRVALLNADRSRDALAMAMADASAAGISTRRLGMLADCSHTKAWELVKEGRELRQEVRDGGS